MKSKLLAAFLLFLLPAIAQATVYDCKVSKAATIKGWLTERYIFEYLPDQGTVQVFDAVISGFNKQQPVDGTMTGASDAKIMFKWALFVMDNTGQRTKMDFRAVLYLANSEFSVQANPVGYIDKFHARGTCTVAN